MPYAEQIIGIYKIVNNVTRKCYVGQSQNINKRIAEHFRLLRTSSHNNPRLQNAFNKYGEDSFSWAVEVRCADVNDLDAIEEAFLKREAWFDEPAVYNIAAFAKAPMRGKVHDQETRNKMSAAQRARGFDHQNPSYLKKLSAAQTARCFRDPTFVAKVRTIVDNPHLSYAERGRRVGTDTSTARKLALRYGHLQGTL